MCATTKDRLLSPTQVAQILNCHRSHVHRLIDAGLLGNVKNIAASGDRALYRIPRSSIERYLEGSAAEIE
jgi:excisionase family DNA binding protein